MNLYTYYRSSAAYRVRIALNLKGLSYTSIPVHLVRNGGEQTSQEYLEKNPQGLVPLLESGEQYINQSLAIIDYLEEAFTETPLLPKQILPRAWVRSLAYSIACDIHPLNNLRVLNYLSKEFAATGQAKKEWYRHWVEIGFQAIEKQLSRSNYMGDFCYGGSPTVADCCLIPQIYNAQRFEVNLAPYPNLVRINQNCLNLSAFKNALPENQADAPVG